MTTRYGRLTVVRAFRDGKTSMRECLCDCGVVKTFRLCNLGRSTKSCGCLAREMAAVKNKGTHHMTGTVEHRAWIAMRQRCFDKNGGSYASYGGRGITVCERWNSFENFWLDMGPRPSKAHSLDRIDNDGDYEPSNCRWATVAQQTNNRRPRDRWAPFKRGAIGSMYGQNPRILGALGFSL